MDSTDISHSTTAPLSNSDDIITINVGGHRFMTSSLSLTRVAGTRLSNLSPAHPAYHSMTNQYFFDRNPAIFNSVLDAFRTGSVHVPPNTCPSLFSQELSYWGLSEAHIARCCWPQYGTVLYQTAKVDAMARSLSLPLCRQAPGDQTPSRWRRWAWRAWVFFEDPTSSHLAKAWGFFYLSMVLLSVALQCMMTHPDFRTPLQSPRRNISMVTNPKMILYATTEPLPVMTHLDEACLAVFLLELVIRVIVCPCYRTFVTCMYNIIDVACVLPMLTSVFVDHLLPDFFKYDDQFTFVFFLSLLGVFRVFRLVKFARHFIGMRVMLLALRASVREILLLLLLVSMGMLIFSTLVYYAEFYTEDDFLTIPVGFWWSIVTMTTVGYGDKHPKTGCGYVVGSLCALTGMLCTGLPIPIIANNFNLFYTHACGQQLKVTDVVCNTPIMEDTEEKCPTCIDNNEGQKERPSDTFGKRKAPNDDHQDGVKPKSLNVDMHTERQNMTCKGQEIRAKFESSYL